MKADSLLNRGRYRASLESLGTTSRSKKGRRGLQKAGIQIDMAGPDMGLRAEVAVYTPDPVQV